MGGSNNYFSVTAMFVMFRECMEAAVIIAVLLQYVTKTQKLHLRKQVWWGAGLGLLISIIFAVIFIIIYYTLNTEVFKGKSEMIFSGVISVIASVMITVLAFGMLKMMALQEKWNQKLKRSAMDALTGKDTFTVRYALFIIAFSAVVREGIESVLFLAGVGVGTPWKAIPLGGAVGALLGLVLGYVLFFGLKPVQLKWFFYISTMVLLFLAAGLMMTGVHKFQEAGAFGYNGPSEGEGDGDSGSSAPPADNTDEIVGGSGFNASAPTESESEKEVPWQNKPLWDICKCCSDADQGFFELARALVGYTCSPTFMHVMAYIGYWLVVIAVFVIKARRGTLETYRLKDDAAVEETASDLEAAPAGAGQEVGSDYRPAATA